MYYNVGPVYTPGNYLVYAPLGVNWNISPTKVKPY